ncbi:MAG: PQQ-binding-like beta-propeller repeat protein [Rubripirellula sp.]
MLHHRQRYRRHACGAVFLIMLLVHVGCSRPPQPDPLELPLSEPASADVADQRTIRQYQTAIQVESSLRSQSSNVATNDWPQLYGPSRNSVAATQAVNLAWGPDGPKQRWSLSIGTGYGSPVVAGNRLVFNHRIDDEEIVQCVDTESGETIWQFRYPTTFVCDVEYSNGPYSTPVIDGDRVFAVGGQGQFFCLSLDSGAIIWSRVLHKEYEMKDGIFPVGASPMVIGDRVIFDVGAEDHGVGILAMDRNDGADIWQSGDAPAGYCAPVAATIHGQSFVFVMTHLGLTSLDPETGLADWSVSHYSRAPMSFNAVTPLVSDNKVLIVTGPGPGAVCLQINPDRTQQELWRDRRVIDCQYNTLMPVGSDVIAFTSAGQGGAELRSVDLATGKLNWKYHSLLRRGQGLVVNGSLVLVGERGHLASVIPTATEANVLAFTAAPIMTEPCFAPPALAGKHLFVRDGERLTCFDLRN